jgi:splicing factor 3A subunit 1
MPDKSEFKLNGQMLMYTLPLTDNVAVIKAKLHEELSMPAGKQKLQYDVSIIRYK